MLWTGLCLLLGLGSLSAQNAVPVVQATGIAQLEAAPAAGQALDSWDATAHHFGALSPREKVSHTFWVTNTGDKPLEIQSVKPGCSCTVTSYTQEPIAPGARGYVQADYQAGTGGRFAKTVLVRLNTETGYTVLHLKGEVQAVTP